MTGDLSLGVAAALGPDAIAVIAASAEQAGFHALWVNDTPDADALVALAAAARVTERIVLATGVLAVDRRPGAEIVRAVRRVDLPEERLVLGIGSGGLRVGALAAVRDTARVLRAETEASVLVGALGPRMRELGALEAHGVLLSWLTPALAAAQADELHLLNPEARVVLYARTSADAASEARLHAEAARYQGYPAYAANAQRLGIDFRETVLPQRGQSLPDGVAVYRDAVDELVLRAITATDEVEEYVRFVEAARG